MNYGPTRAEKIANLSPPLQQFINDFDRYYDIDQKITLSRSYITGLNFLVFLQGRNVNSLNNVTFEDVRHSFIKKDNSFKEYRYANHLRNFFSDGIVIDESNCQRILSYIPQMSKNRKTIQYLTHEEVATIREALDSPTSNLSYRDRAIGMLLLYTGIRACDIIHLTFSNIHWSEELIILVQQKTKKQLRIPLRPIVGNAIYRYIEYERPECSSDRVFLSSIEPVKELHDGSCGSIIRKILKCAGVRLNKGDRKGTHIFRHHVVSKLLENNSERPLISFILGQVSPNSLDPYLNTDIEHLRQCSLSVSKFSNMEKNPHEE